MPSFCTCGSEQYVCQSCARIRCSKEQPSKWFKNTGNVCPECQKFYPEFSTSKSWDGYDVPENCTKKNIECGRCPYDTNQRDIMGCTVNPDEDANED